MSDLHQAHSQTPIGAEAEVVDLGLRSYMLGVYNKVGLGLLLAASVAYATANVPVLRDLMDRARKLDRQTDVDQK